AQAHHCEEADCNARRGVGEAPARVRRPRRTEGAARRDHVAGARSAAEPLAFVASTPDECDREALPVPERVDRHWRPLRLVARRAGAPPAHRRRLEGHAHLGNRIQERASRPPCARGGGSESALRFDVRGEKGYSLVEMLTVMVIMGIVLGGLTQVFTSASKADIDMNNRFNAQVQTRLALDKLRRDIHCAYDLPPNTPNPWTSSQSSVTLKITAC